MIQRIQSIWLLLASACAFATLKLPTYSGTQPDGRPSYELMGMENFILILPTIAIGVIALINIFLYKNRTLQFRLCILAIVLELLLMFLYYREIATYLDGTISLTALLHVGVLIFLILAARGIRYDDNIIKESSRLR
jgi:hypothetical protein